MNRFFFFEEGVLNLKRVVVSGEGVFQEFFQESYIFVLKVCLGKRDFFFDFFFGCEEEEEGFFRVSFSGAGCVFLEGVWEGGRMVEGVKRFFFIKKKSSPFLRVLFCRGCFFLYVVFFRVRSFHPCFIRSHLCLIPYSVDWLNKVLSHRL